MIIAMILMEMVYRIMEEISLGTDPYNVDSDEDGLTDYFEVRISLTNPLNPDTDRDGITDYHEDFDQDGFNNGQEQAQGTNPYKKIRLY